MNIVIGVPNGILSPIHEPVPRISLTEPIVKRESVKPSPIPSPSRIEGISLFFDAKASARPRIMQFTVISERKSPRLS